MNLFVVYFVRYDHDGNEWLVLKSIYDNIEKCYDYIKNNRKYENKITLIHQYDEKKPDGACDAAYNQNFNNVEQCDYVIEQRLINT